MTIFEELFGGPILSCWEAFRGQRVYLVYMGHIGPRAEEGTLIDVMNPISAYAQVRLRRDDGEIVYLPVKRDMVIKPRESL